MVSADALTIFSGIIILFRNSGKSADFPELPFHGRSHNRKRKLPRWFLRKHSRGGVNVLPASTSLSSTTPAHENGVQKHPQAFLDPKIKNIISLAYAQSNAERIQNRPTQQESAFCFTPSLAQSHKVFYYLAADDQAGHRGYKGIGARHRAALGALALGAGGRCSDTCS